MGVNNKFIKMKKLIIIFFTILSCQINLKAQPKSAGKVTYRMRFSWTKLITKSTYLTQEEKDRASNTWKNYDEEDVPDEYYLHFKDQKSFYSYKDEYYRSEDGSYSSKKDPMFFSFDFNTQTQYHLFTALIKPKIIQEAISNLNWKILNDIKEVQGFMCMKASLYDSTKNQNIEAWFSMDIPISAGPAKYQGLPGLILEIASTDGIWSYTATAIEIDPNVSIPVFPKKVKGQKITWSNLLKTEKEYIKNQEKMHEIPWGMGDW
jgi:GLPGLI family protein